MAGPGLTFWAVVFAFLALWIGLVNARVFLPYPHLLLLALAGVVCYECWRPRREDE